MKKAISTEQTSANIAALIQLLAATPQQLVHWRSTLSPEQLITPLGSGERSFAQDVAHLINCEARVAETIYAALLLESPLILKIHPERQWGKLLQYEQFGIDDLLAYFAFRRQILLRVLNSLSDTQWSRTIQEAGKQRHESVYWQGRGLALHEDEHLRDLEKKLSS